MASKLCPFCMRMSEGETCPHCGKNTNYIGSQAHLPAGYVVSGKHPYVLGAALGQGGFGITYIALDMVTNERVAIKEYFPTYCSSRTHDHTVSAYPNQEDIYNKGRDHFLDEARTLKSLSDLKNIVNVLDFFEANNSAYLVMEFLDGSSLKAYSAQHGKFPARKFLEQITPLMEDLERMHQRGVVHRDIAPDNIILLPDGQMKLIDFGAARSYVGDKSMTVVVKKGFAPVEQYLSKGTAASTDVYALAATIYYCITGTVPTEAPERQYENIPLRSPSSFGADLTPGQEKALEKAMEILQKERTQSVQEFLDALRAKEPAKQKSAPSKSAEKKPKKKFPALLAVAAAGLVLLGGFFLLPDKDSGDADLEESVSASQPSLQQSSNQASSNNSSASVTYTVEIDGKTYSASSQEEIDEIINQSIMGMFPSDEPDLSKDALTIEESTGEYNNQRYKYSFVIKNNTKQNLTSVGLSCTLLDEEDNIVGTESAWLHTTIPAGKKATIESSIYNMDASVKKIAVDYAYYDTNGDNNVSTFYFSREIIEKYTIMVDPSQNVMNDPDVLKASAGEQNALKSALFYLDSIPFSYSGLVKQLKYEGYSQSEAEFAAENCGANWNEQAALSAKKYLDSMSFSRSGLITQLEYEGFTHEQAIYGVDKSYK